MSEDRGPSHISRSLSSGRPKAGPVGSCGLLWVCLRVCRKLSRRSAVGGSRLSLFFHGRLHPLPRHLQELLAKLWRRIGLLGELHAVPRVLVEILPCWF